MTNITKINTSKRNPIGVLRKNRTRKTYARCFLSSGGFPFAHCVKNARFIRTVERGHFALEFGQPLRGPKIPSSPRGPRNSNRALPLLPRRAAIERDMGHDGLLCSCQLSKITVRFRIRKAEGPASRAFRGARSSQLWGRGATL